MVSSQIPYHIFFQIFVIINGFLWGSSCLPSTGFAGNLQYLYTKVKPEVQVEAGTKVIERLFPNRSSEFRLEINKGLTATPYEDAFLVYWDDTKNQVVASGTTAVSALFGLNYYLKYYCNIHIAWEGSQLNLPNELPRLVVGGPILDRFRYYQNVCTESYTFVWWDWSAWEKHIDWMVLNGINFPLAFTGQEMIWEKVYLSLGLTLDEIDDFFSGPAFLAWSRMGNLQKWGGPLPRNYSAKKFQLLHNILNRTRSLGMLPILPAFAGTVPRAFTTLFPKASFVQHPSWNGFNSSYTRTFMLEPTDPLFIEVGKNFMNEMIAEFGTDHVYNCDTFNEIDPTSSNVTYLRSVSKATFKSMIAEDPKAVWVIQGWTFMSGFWTKEAVKGYLSGVQVGNIIVLDLYSERAPLYLKFNSYYGHSFIWCMLHNFGGLLNLFGNLDGVNQGVAAARKLGQNITMIGTGLTPEGINQNYVVYEFMTEMSLASSPLNVEGWIHRYAERRYGATNKLVQDSWRILLKGVYSAPSWVHVRAAALITSRPRLNLVEEVWYPLNDTQIVVENFIFAGKDPTFSNSKLFRHDLVDFTRQFLQHMGSFAYQHMVAAYKGNKTYAFLKFTEAFLDIFDDMDTVLKTSSRFLLGEWTSKAESWGTSEEDIKLLRFNSLNQITLWGPRGEIIDYAAKQWSGMISNYYKMRWTLFVSYLNASLLTGDPVDMKSFNENVLNAVEIPFTETSADTAFSTYTEGDSIAECTRVYNKWKNPYIRSARKYSFSPPVCASRQKRLRICHQGISPSGFESNRRSRFKI